MLSGNDRRRIERGLDLGEEHPVLEWDLPGGAKLKVSICRAVPVWGVACLIRVERWERNVYSTQYFSTVEEMVRYG